MKSTLRLGIRGEGSRGLGQVCCGRAAWAVGWSIAVTTGLAVFSISGQSARAQATYYLTASDGGGTSSFTSPLTGAAAGFSLTGVAPGAAAAAGNNYIDAGFNIRTPASNTASTFAGNSLSLAPTGTLFSSEMVLKNNATSSVLSDTVNLILNGGFCNEGSGNGTAATAVLAGTMSVTGLSALGADAAETLQINSTVSGGGALQIGGGIVNGVLINVGQSQGTVYFTGSNTNYSGAISVGSLTGTSSVLSSANAYLQGSNSGSTNIFQAFGTGTINLYSAVNSTSGATNGYTGITGLTLLANGSGSGQTIVTGSSATAENNLNISGSATVYLNHFSGSDTGNTFQFGNLSIGGSAGTTSLLTLTTTSGYGFQIAGTTSVTGPAAIINASSASFTFGAITNAYSNAASLTLLQSPTASRTITSAAPISDNGTNPLSIIYGGGLWTLSGTSNTYSGATGISGGTLALGVANTVPVVSPISFSGSSTLNMGAFSPTFGGLSTTVASGSTAVATVVGTGSLTLSSTSGTFQMNTNTSGSTALNLSGISAFSANVSEFDVGTDPATSPAGSALLVLSPSNTIVAPTLYVGKGNNNASGLVAGMILGASNTLNVGNLYVAAYKGTSAGLASEIWFNGQPGTLTLAGSAGGGSRAEVYVGLYNYPGGTGASSIGTIDLTGGTANVLIDTLTLGMGSSSLMNAGTLAEGTFNFNAGSVNVNTMIVGQSTIVITNTASGGLPIGNFTMGGGTLTVNNALTLASSAGLLSSTGSFNLNGGVALVNCNITGGGGTSTFNFNGGTLMPTISSANFMQGLTAAYVGSNGAFINPNGNNITIGQSLLQSGTSTGGLTVSGNGILTLAGSSTYTGSTTINGVLNAAFLANVNTPSPIGQGSALGSPADLVINGGTLQYTGSTPTGTNRLFTIGPNGAAIDASGSLNGGVAIGSGGGSIAFSSTSGPATLTLTGSGTGPAAGTFGAVLGDSNPGAFATSLVKMGAGSWILGAANTYSGPTSVSAGGLYVNGSLLSSGTVSVAAGAVLGGTGSAGNAFIAPGGGIDVSGNGTGTLTLSSLNFNGGGTIAMPAPTSTASLAIQAGNLTGGGGAGSVQIDFPNAPVANGTYRLIGYSGTIGGAGFSAFTVAQSGALGARQTPALLNNSGEIDYQVTGQTPYWNGTQSDWLATNAWTLQPSGSQTTFVAGDNDVFDDSAGSGAIAVSINQGNVNPISVTFNNNAASYSLSGAFGITDGPAGPTFLAKNGGGSLTIATSNNYSGGTTLNAGLLNINNPAALGSGALSINGGTLDNSSGAPITLSTNNPQSWNADVVFLGSNNLNLGTGPVTLGASRVVTVASGDLTVGGPIGGAGFSLTKAGSGTLTLSGANTYNSGTFVLAGVLELASNNGLYAGGNITTSGGTLDLGGLGQSTSGAISFQGGTVQNGTLTQTGPAAFDAESGIVTAVLAGNIGLNKTTSGAVTLGAVNLYTGATTISAGVLQSSASNGLGVNGDITITGGTLDLGGLGQSTTGAINFQGGVVQNGSLTQAGATNFNAQSGTVNAVLAGNVGLDKTTSGTVTLGANNLFSGAVTVSAGMLRLAGSNVYAGNTNVSGGTLALLASNALPATTTLVFAGSPTVDLGGTTSQTIAGLTATAANTSVIQNIGAGQTLNIVNSGTGAVVGVNSLSTSNSVSLIVSGPGALVIAASNGSFTMNTGGLQANVTSVNMSALGAFSANVNEFDVGINPTGNSNGGNSLLTLAASNTIVAQNLYVGKGPNNQGNTFATMYLGASNTLDVGNLYVGTGKQGLAVSPSGCVVSFNPGAPGPGTLTLAGSSGAGSLAEVTLGWYNVNDTGNSPTGTIDLTGGTANVNIDTLILGKGDTTTLDAQNPTGTFIFNAGAVNVNNLYAGVTTTNNTTKSGAVTGNFTIGGGTLTVNEALMLGYNEGGATAPTGTFNLNGGVALLYTNIVGTGVYSGASFFNFNGGTLMSGSGSTNFLQVTQAAVENGGAVIDTDGNNIVINQNLLAAGSGGLTKKDSGMLTLGGANTYTGGTTVSGGTLQLGNNAALGAPTGPLTVNGSTLDLNGNGSTIGAVTVGALSGNSGGLITNNGSFGSILTVSQSTATTYSGSIANGASTVGLALTGRGTLVLTGSNTYSGGTSINAGTLEFATTSAMPATGTVSVASSATLGAGAGGANQFTNATSGAGSIGGLLAGIGAQGGPVNWAAGAVLGIDTTSAVGGSLTYSGNINDTNSGATSLGLAKLGPGTLVLTGTNTYSGGTTVADGTLILDASTSLADGSTLTVGQDLSAFAPVSPASPAGIAAVPEPAAMGLLLAAVAGVAAIGRVRRKMARG
jgi:fibronectin-binding autotransporter adhesin